MIALVLAATGVFVYLQFQNDVNSTVDAGLRSRADELSATVRRSGSGVIAGGQQLVGRTESFAEVLEPSGKVIDSSPAVGEIDLLDPDQLRAAAAGPVFVDLGPLPGLDRGSRPARRPREGPRRQADRRRRRLDRRHPTTPRPTSPKLLLLGLPAALILASIAGYGVATAALRPVEAMRARAEEISTASPDERLPVPATRDEVARLGETLNEMLARLGDALEPRARPSSPTPAMSCARRWRSSAPSSSWHSPRGARPRSCAPRSPPPPRRPTASRSSPRTC